MHSRRNPLWFFSLVLFSAVAIACSEKPGNDDPATDAGTEPPASDAGNDTDAGSGSHLAAQVVGAAGGTLAATGGASIEIPAGALPADVTITIDEVTAPAPNGATSLGKTIQFGPEGQTFAAPVKVKLPWSGPSNVPVEIAHAPRGGTAWTVLTDNAGFDATHVWAETTSFSWFQPVVYQGAPDTPIILDKVRPTGWTKLVALGSTPNLHLNGTGFRGDTVVKLFKDGVTTATVSSVTLTGWGLDFTIPAAFTATLGLITVEAKNPQATVGDQAAVHVVKTPVLQGLSPSTIDVQENQSNDYRGINRQVTVTAADLPDDLSLCEVQISQSFGQMAVLVAKSDLPVATAGGFTFTVADWNRVTGTSDLVLQCSGVTSNKLAITFKLIPM